MIGFMGPSLGTSISGTGSELWHFAQSPDQWDMLREDPNLIRNAINKALSNWLRRSGTRPIRIYPRSPEACGWL